VAASNEDLNVLVRKGAFRKDLYYRLKVAWVHLPPLRERREDIPLLIRAFLRERRGSGDPPEMSEEAIALLMDHDYPGNVRELKSIVQSARNLCRGGVITVSCLPDYIQRRGVPHGKQRLDASGPIVPLSELEKEHILTVYERMNGNKSRTAHSLGIGLNTLRRKLASYGVS
jgi:two-component system response regulator AtoC